MFNPIACVHVGVASFLLIGLSACTGERAESGPHDGASDGSGDDGTGDSSGGDVSGSGDDDTGDDEALTWEDLQVDRPEVEPQWSAEELQDVLNTWATSYGVPNAPGVIAEYTSAMLEGDADCPGTDTDDIIQSLSGCTASTGWTYNGLSILDHDSSSDTGSTYETASVEFSVADFVITRPDGLRFVVGGRAAHSWSHTSASGTNSSTTISGTWVHEWTDISWLQEPVSVDLEVVRQGYTPTWLRIDGQMTVGGVSMVWDNIDIDDSECTGLPAEGTIWVRQDDGSWVELVIADDCTGCGTATWNGEQELGEVSLDFSHTRTGLISVLERKP